MLCIPTIFIPSGRVCRSYQTEWYEDHNFILNEVYTKVNRMKNITRLYELHTELIHTKVWYEVSVRKYELHANCSDDVILNDVT